MLFLDQLLNFTTSLHCPACFTRHTNLQVQALLYSTQVSFTSTWVRTKLLRLQWFEYRCQNLYCACQ